MTNTHRYSASDLPELMEKIARNSIGLDDYFQQFWNTNTNANYPPYNIVHVNNVESRLEIALAGFKKKEVKDVTFADGLLTITLGKIVPEHHAKKVYL